MFYNIQFQLITFILQNVILNSVKGGQAQTEMKVDKLPIKSGEQFKISITNDVHGFQAIYYFRRSVAISIIQIFVNEEFFTTFEHRMCPFDIAEVEVSSHVLNLGMELQ